MARNALSPVRVLKDDEAVKVYYLDTGREFRLNPGKPIEVLTAVPANDDPTTVEVVSEQMLAVRQLTEFGEPQTIMLSPRMAAELAHLLDSYLFIGPND